MQIFPEEYANTFVETSGNVNSRNIQILRKLELQITFDRFYDAMSNRLKRLDDMYYRRKLFKALDTNSKGFLTMTDFIALCKAIYPYQSTSTLAQIFRELDLNGDEKLSFKEFELCSK